MKIDNLYSCYAGLETDWIERNRCVFEAANDHGLAVAGSIAMAVACKKARKVPGDIDLVCVSPNDAMAFISALQLVLMRYHSHWRIFVNHENDFVPVGSTTHFRFQSAMWMPVCIMVIPCETFRFWFAPGGMRVQQFQFVKDAAKKLEAVDGKDRTSAFDAQVADDFEAPPDQGVNLRITVSSDTPPTGTYRRE